MVDALGFEGGCAKKGEQISIDQIGEANVERLKLDGAICPDTSVVEEPAEKPAAAVETEPTEPLENFPDFDVINQLAEGIAIPEGYELTPPDLTDLYEIANGFMEFDINVDAINDLTVREIAARIISLGGEPIDVKGKKAVAVQALIDAINAYIKTNYAGDDTAQANDEE